MNDQINYLVGASKESVRNIYETMLSANVEFVSMANPEEVREKKLDCIMALIGMDGDFKGSIGVVVSNSMAKEWVTLMLGLDDASESDISDVVGEMANMVAGGMKNTLESKIPNFNITCPTVIRGQFNFPKTPTQRVEILKFKATEEFYTVIVSMMK